MKRDINSIFLDDIGVCTQKKVLLRLDWNVSIDHTGTISDTERITKTFPLLQQLSLVGATSIVMAHLGEEGESLDPIVDFVEKHLSFVKKITTTNIEEVRAILDASIPGEIYILPNIRTFQGEIENDRSLALSLASLASVYINDAFSVSHRKHASVVSIPQYILSYAGPLFKEELTHLTPLLKPELPALLILGGAKISSKLALIKTYLDRGVFVFVGGAMVHNILKQTGHEIGTSLYDPTYTVDESIIDHPHLLVPVDVVTDDRESSAIEDMKKDRKIVDCGKLTLSLLESHIKKAKTIIMNGPVGLYEEGWMFGTEVLLSEIGHTQGKKTVIGGGDTLTVLQGIHEHLHFSFVSLAGGAMLTFLTEGTLPGIEALEKDVTL